MPADLDNKSWAEAVWQAPSWIRAGTSTRIGGYSQAPYDSLNLAGHIGDTPDVVEQNRRILGDYLGLPSDPVWLEQVHGTRIIEAGDTDNLQADGSHTRKPGVVCAILTADCLPLLLCDQLGTEIAAIHVGWRGLSAGIISSAIDRFVSDAEGLFAWIGPHISQNCYEVGDDVYRALIDHIPAADSCFTASPAGRWYASLELLVREALSMNNVSKIASANLCTFKNDSEFYSYRRENLTGRMASLIWIEEDRPAITG